MQVFNASIYVRFVNWDGEEWPEVFQAPGSLSLSRKVYKVYVRSAVAGVPAQVTIEMLAPGDIGY